METKHAQIDGITPQQRFLKRLFEINFIRGIEIDAVLEGGRHYELQPQDCQQLFAWEVEHTDLLTEIDTAPRDESGEVAYDADLSEKIEQGVLSIIENNSAVALLLIEACSDHY